MGENITKPEGLMLQWGDVQGICLVSYRAKPKAGEADPGRTPGGASPRLDTIASATSFRVSPGLSPPALRPALWGYIVRRLAHVNSRV